MNMTLNDVLSDVKMHGNDGMQTKTASTQPASNAQQELVSALRQIVSGNEEKTASVETPAQSVPAVDALVKMASDLAGTEQQALVKEAHLYGAAVADGFVSRLNQYDQSLDAAGVKTASAEEFVPSEEEFNKFASANPDLIQQALSSGYSDTMAQINQVKTASADEAELIKIASTPEGQAEAAMLEKLASTEEGRTKLAGVRQGFDDAMDDIVKLAATEEGQQKLADIRQGYDDTIAQVEKVAGDCYSQGYVDTINLIGHTINA